MTSGYAGAALAQDAAPGEATRTAGTVEEVIVTATRRAQNVQDILIAVTAVSGEQLAAAGVSTRRS